MGVQLKQLADGSAGMEGKDAGSGGYVPVSTPYVATITSGSVFTADRSYVVQAIRGRVDVAGTGGACTMVVRKVSSGTAGGSGTALHTGSYNLVGTASAIQTLSLSTTAADLLIAAGDSIYFSLTGTPTSAVGNITVTLSPA